MKKIPEKILNIIDKFVDIMGYMNNQNVLGIVFYGSYVHGNYDDNSDIDIHVFMSNKLDISIRGAMTIDGIKVEYFEKPIGVMYREVDMQYSIQNDNPISMFLDGKVIFERNNDITKFREYIKEKYKNGLSVVSEDLLMEKAIIIENRIRILEDYLNHGYIDGFNALFYIVVDFLREFYTKLTGKSTIPNHKVFVLFTDSDYLNAYNKTIPDREFVRRYLDTIDSKIDEYQKLQRLKELYKYSIKGMKVDSGNYRLCLRKK